MTLMNQKLNRGVVPLKNGNIVNYTKPQQKRKGQSLNNKSKSLCPANMEPQ